MEDEDGHRAKRQKMSPPQILAGDQRHDEEPIAPLAYNQQGAQAEQSTQQSLDMGQAIRGTTGLDVGVGLASDEANTEQLQKDMGDAFLICKFRKALVPCPLNLSCASIKVNIPKLSSSTFSAES